jgi:hypothetical protein
MADPSLAPEVTVWTDAGSAAMAGRVLDLMGSAVRPIGVGGTRSAEVDALARRLGVPFEDDFRKMIVDRPATFVLLASAAGASVGAVASAVADGSVVLAMEPPGASLEDLIASRSRTAARADVAPGRLIHLPAFLRGRGWASAADPIEVIGKARLVSFVSFGLQAEGSLFARLYDAWQSILSLAPLPESIDASLVTPLAKVPTTLHGITGHFAGHARLPDSASAVFEVSDRAGRSLRRLRVIGDNGQVRAGDVEYQLLDGTGKLLDQRSPAGASDAPSYADMIVAQWTRLLGRPDLGAGEPRGPEEPQVLACCVASLLSARTRQPESPVKLLEIQR